MTSDLRIARLRKHYRLPADATDEQARLDRVLTSAIEGDVFDAALERAGISSSDEICIRRVDSVVRLDRAHSDSRLAVAWSVALADAIASRLQEGGPDVVRYRSRYRALVDMTCSATCGELDRAWAWRSLGIWFAADAIGVANARVEAVTALAREARLAPAAIDAVARLGLLPSLVACVPAEHWITLARAVLIESGGGRCHPYLSPVRRRQEPERGERRARRDRNHRRSSACR